MKRLKKTLILAVALIVPLCSGCSPNQHILDELERCKETYGEECTLMVVPVTKVPDIRELHKKWGDNTQHNGNR